jgi:hypothetical protein
MLRFANRVVQTGFYREGFFDSPDYVSLAGGIAANGYQTVADVATPGSWQEGDTVGILLIENADNMWLGEGIYQSDGDISIGAEAFSVGSISYDAEVTLSIVPLASHMGQFLRPPEGDGAFVGTFSGWEPLANHIQPPAPAPDTSTAPELPEPPQTIETDNPSIMIPHTNDGDTLYLSREGFQAAELASFYPVGYEIEIVKRDHELFVKAPPGEGFLAPGSVSAESASLTPTYPVIVKVKKVTETGWVIANAAFSYDTPDPRADPHFADVELLLDFEGPPGGLIVADSSLNQHPVSAVADPAGTLENTETGIGVGNSALLASPSTLPGAPGSNVVTANVGTFDLGTGDFVIEMFFTPTEEIIV